MRRLDSGPAPEKQALREKARPPRSLMFARCAAPLRDPAGRFDQKRHPGLHRHPAHPRDAGHDRRRRVERGPRPSGADGRSERPGGGRAAAVQASGERRCVGTFPIALGASSAGEQTFEGPAGLALASRIGGRTDGWIFSARKESERKKSNNDSSRDRYTTEIGRRRGLRSGGDVLS